MPLNNYPIDVVGITIEADPSALKLAQNLADLPDSATARSNLGLGNYLQLAGGTMTGAVHVTQINNTLNTDLVIDSYNDTGAGTHYLHKFTPYDGKFNLATNGGGLVFPDGTIQTTATVTGPAGTNGTNGTNGTMNYLDIVTVTSSTASSTWSGWNWYVNYGFMNTSSGWFYNKLNVSGVNFKLYINGVYDSSVSNTYSNTSVAGSFATQPVTNDVVTVFVANMANADEATIPFITFIA